MALQSRAARSRKEEKSFYRVPFYTATKFPYTHPENDKFAFRYPGTTKLFIK
jgi:hypothetical protein